MSQKSDLQQPLCGDPQCPGLFCPGCQAFIESETIHKSIPCPHKASYCCAGKLCDKCFDKKYPKEAFGGGKGPDVIPEQDFKLYFSGTICEDCQKLKGSNPDCDLCATLKLTKNDSQPPFTKRKVEQVYAEMKSGFRPSREGYMFDLIVPLSSLTIGRINWTMHNRAVSTLVQMLASSNPGMNSINQQTFAGYILAFIIKRLQESGECDPILLEVFRLELTILSKNPAWSNWSELVEFQDLYKECVRHRIIFDKEVEFVLPNEDGSYNIGQTLNGKRGSTLVGAYNWPPCINVLANGILSQDLKSKFRVSAVVLHCDNHFWIIVISQGIWLIDGKGTRNGPFKAESSIQELTTEQFQLLCRSHGAFYFFEEVPPVYEMRILSGIQGLPPRKVFYVKGWYFLYEDGIMICETTGTRVNLKRSVFVHDNFGNHLRLFPVLPPPPAPCASGPWSPPPAFPPPPPPCANVAQALPPPPSQPAPCAEVALALPPSPPDQSQHVININVLRRFVDPCSGISKWSVSVVDPKDPEKMFFEETGVCVESTNQRGMFLYTFDSDPLESKKLYKQSKEVNNFIKELNKRFNERSK
jgi:hypothetical protein